ncbi:MAG: hypothetical protein QOH15_641, partial [Gaiellales bacterium]|jgi:hypothetical protein|nr:hypothetical protein [Gaiellales bacterium]
VSVRDAEVSRLIARGIERGDLAADTDEVTAHELLIAPVYYRLLLSGDPLDHAFAERIVDAAMRAFAPSR